MEKNYLENQIDILNNKIENINLKLNNIEILLLKISNETNRMDSHVSFVENIYNQVKSPFFYLMHKINIISNNKLITFA